MKKMVLFLLTIYVVTSSVFVFSSPPCESCLSSHQDVSKSCHSVEKIVQNSSCCSLEVQSSSNSCVKDNPFLNDCQICAHTDQPPAKIEASVNLKMDNKFIIALPEAQNAFSNQIPPPDIQPSFSTYIPPITANHLVFLEPIRLLI